MSSPTEDPAGEVGFPDSVDIYLVATSYSPSQPNWPPSAWLEREGWTIAVIVDDPQSTAYEAFGQGAFFDRLGRTSSDESQR